MTWTAVSPNPAGAIHNVTSASITTHAVGNLIVLVNTLHSDTAFPTGVSSSRVTWTKVPGSDSSFSNAAISTAPAQWQGNIWLGTVNSTGTDTVTFTYTGGVTPSFTNAVMQEFTSSVGSWHVDTFTFLNSAAGTAAWPSLTPAGSGELYLGFAWNQGSAVSGSTSGYVYNANADGASNGMAYNLNCASGTATAPTWGDSTETYGLMVLVAEGAASSGAVTLLPQPGSRNWQRRHRRHQPAQIPPPAGGTAFVKNTASTFQASGTSTLAITAPVTSTAGNTLVMSMEIFSYAWTSGNAVPTITSISDGTANVWHFSSSAGSQNPPTGGSFSATSGHAAIAAVAYCVNAAAVSGTVTLNVAATNSTDLEGVFIVTEFSGVQAGAVVSGASSSVFTQGDPQTTPAVSMPANSAVVAYGAKDSGNVPAVAPSFLTEFDRCGACGVPGTDQGSTGVTFTFGATTTVNGTAVLAISPPGAGTTHNGSVSLSGTGTLTATGTAILPGAAALSGSGTLTATGNTTRARTATLSGAGTLTATGALVLPGAATLSGTGTLTATENTTRARTVGFSGTGILTATGNTTRVRAATLSGAGTLTATENTTRARTASLSGTGTLTPAGSKTVPGSALLSGAGALTANGALQGFHPGTAALTGAGTLTATESTTRARTAALSGSGALAAAGFKIIPGTALMTGAGTLTATEHTARARTASLSGTGLLTVAGFKLIPGTALMTGAGTLTITEHTARARTVSLAGNGTLTAPGFKILPGAAVLSGSGTLSAHRGQLRSGTLQITIPGDVYRISGALAVVLPAPRTSLTALNGTLGAFSVHLPKPVTGLTGKVIHNPLRIALPKPFTTITGRIIHNALHVGLGKPATSLAGTVVHNGPLVLQLNQRGGGAPEHPARIALTQALRPGTTDTAVNGHDGASGTAGSQGSTRVHGSDGASGVR